MVEASYPGYTVITSEVVAPRRIGVGTRTFWALFVVEAALIGLVLVAVLSLLPQRSPLAAGADREQVRAAVLDRLSGTVVDPLVSVGSGQIAHTSNLRGFRLHDTTYYYYLEGQASFDPLSQGAVSRDQVEIVLRDASGPHPLVIYILRAG